MILLWEPGTITCLVFPLRNDSTLVNKPTGSVSQLRYLCEQSAQLLSLSLFEYFHSLCGSQWDSLLLSRLPLIQLEDLLGLNPVTDSVDEQRGSSSRAYLTHTVTTDWGVDLPVPQVFVLCTLPAPTDDTGVRLHSPVFHEAQPGVSFNMF